jgi:hypothetical protein
MPIRQQNTAIAMSQAKKAVSTKEKQMSNTFDYSKLKEGDKVLVQSSGTMCQPDHIGIVTKVTKTQIQIDDNYKYNRTYGNKCGDSGWSTSHIYELTPEKEERIYHEKLARYVNHYAHNSQFVNFTNEDLYTLKNVIDKYKEK